MSAEPLRLDDLLESVADGLTVDWDAAEASADPQELRLLRHLRVVASIAEVHRTVPADEAAASGNTTALKSDSHDPVSSWGRLLLLGTIGEGAFGEVYRAHDAWLDREVALKLLKPGSGAPTPAARVLDEARTLARVHHPNVVTVHGADMHDGRVGLWMELVRGRTLAQIVAEQGPLSAADAAIVGQELCRALDAVHGAGLVHRDVKAQNVMREAGGRVVLMDFGAGHTPLYLAPELLACNDATVQSDIYALGVLLYYLVTGSYPIKGASLNHLKEAHARGERQPLGEVRTDLPDGFVGVVERAIDPEPARRFSSAREMQDALGRVARANPTAVRPAYRIHILVGGSRRRRSIIAATLALVAGAALVWRQSSTENTATASPIRLLAVMPLHSEAAEAAYFANGMTEAVMQELARVKSVRIVSRTSVDLARQAEKTLPGIAKVLNADAILEGSVNRDSDRVRVSLRLIHAGSDTPVWARTFEQSLRDTFALQRELARSVAAELSPAFTVPDEVRQPVNTQAQDAFMRGSYYLRTVTQTSQQQAISHFQQALLSDPEYAPAYAGIAQAYLTLGGSLDAMPVDEGFRLARNAVEQALQLDEQLADAHTVFGVISFEYDWDWARAEREFVRALAANPSHQYARERYAMFLVSRGHTDAALSQMEQARQVDPLSPDVGAAIGTLLRYARRYEEAAAQYRNVLAAHPKNLRAELGLARTLNAMRQHDAALELFGSMKGPSRARIAAEMIVAQAGAGRLSEARANLAQLRRDEAEGEIIVPRSTYAYIYAYLGRKDEAFGFLRDALDWRDVSVLWLLVDPRFDPLRDDSRFRSCLARLGLS
jgi:serine/threonine protein kinase/tetratricopeptide (TPR) repeat protein